MISPTSDFANITFANVLGRFAKAKNQDVVEATHRVGEATKDVGERDVGEITAIRSNSIGSNVSLLFNLGLGPSVPSI